jgi:hypothetical protein
MIWSRRADNLTDDVLPLDCAERSASGSSGRLRRCASGLGTTRSRVSFFMNKFRKLGFIEYNGKLEVHNSLLNVVLHDKPEIKTRDASS